MAYIFRNPVEGQIEGLRQQLQALHIRREVLGREIQGVDEQINQLTAILQSLQPMVDLTQSSVNSLDGKSLADLCRLALNTYGSWMTAHQVRSYLEQLGVQFQYVNVMAVLHNTLKRVGQTGRDNFGNTVYAPKD
jgi:hypothetical protein